MLEIAQEKLSAVSYSTLLKNYQLDKDGEATYYRVFLLMQIG
ncbi:hypothetical protein ACVNPZ_03190 [Staphylococcus aureus]